MFILGKAVSKALKFKAEVLLKEFPEEFDESFEKNVSSLKKMSELLLSKSDRNVLAGYIGRLATKVKKLN